MNFNSVKDLIDALEKTKDSLIKNQVEDLTLLALDAIGLLRIRIPKGENADGGKLQTVIQIPNILFA